MPEYVVEVKAWPAYVLVAVAIVSIPLYGVALPWLVLKGSSTMLVFLLVFMMIGGAVQIVAMLWAARPVRVGSRRTGRVVRDRVASTRWSTADVIVGPFLVPCCPRTWTSVC